MRGNSLLLLITLTLGSCTEAGRTLRAAPILPGRGPFPLFQVECRNETSQPVERVGALSALRFDGGILEPGFVGSFLGGPPAQVPSRSTWTETVSVAPIGSKTSGVGVRAFQVSLQPGRHSVAFRCAGLWSEEVQFYWAP
jgi:hypothetical protein